MNASLCGRANLIAWQVPLVAIVMAAAASLAAPSAWAQSTYYWNGADASASPAGGGTSTWNTSTANWRQTTDTGSAVAWPGTSSGADTAVFAGTSGTVTLSGSLAANALSFTVGGYTLTGGTLGLDGTTPTLSVTTGTATISSIVAGTGGAVKSGAGTLILSGANGAGFSGGVTVSAGVLQINAATAVGSGTITLGDSNTGAGSVQLTLGSNVDRPGFTNAITVSSQASGAATIKWVDTGNTSATGNGTITLNRATVFDATQVAQVAGGYYLFNHPLSGTGDIALTNSNGTRFLLQASSGSYTGNITVQSGGILEPRDKLSAATGNNITVEAGGQLQVFATSNIGSLAGSGTVQSLNSNGTLSVGKGNASGTFAGIMRENASFILSFTKTGSGTQTLTGSNSYKGATTVSGGVLRIGDGGTTGSLSGSTAISVSSGAALAFFRSDALTVSNTITGAGNFTQLGSGTLTLAGTNTYSGTTTVNSGVLAAGGSSAFGSGASLVVNGGTVDLGGYSINVGSLSGSSGVTITTGAAAGTATLATSFASGTSTFAGTIADNGSGVVALTKSGSGTLAVTGANTYTGATTVSGGVLRVGDGATAGSLASSTLISVSTGGTLAFWRSDAVTVSNTISGAGGLTQLGSGTLTLVGNNTYSGTTTVSAGALRIGDGGTTGSLAGSSAIAVSSGATLTFFRSDALTVSNTISGAGSLTHLGSGPLTLTGNSAFTGPTTFSAANLVIGDGGTTGSIRTSSTISVGSGLTLRFNRTDDYGGAYSGAIAGSGGLLLERGTLTLSGTSSYAAGTTISSGTLVIGGTAAVGGGTITLGDGNTGSSDVQITINSGIDRGGAFLNAITVANQGTGRATLTFNDPGTVTTGTGTITLNRPTTFDVTGLTGSAWYQFAHPLSGTGNMTLTNSNGTRFILHSASSAGYTGDITIQSGGIFEPRDRLLAATGNNITVESGGQLRIQATTTSIGSLVGSGTVQSVDSNGTLSVGKGNVSGTFAGIMRNNPTILSFTKTGSGTQTLTGSNSYTGATTISGGVLRIGDGGTTGSLSGSTAISVSSGATLAFFRSDALAVSNAISGAGGLTQLGSGTLALAATNGYSGATTVSAGTLLVGNGATAGSIGSTSGVSVASGATLAFNRTDTYGGTFNRVVSGSGGIRVLAGRLTLGGSNTYSGPTVVAGGTLAPTAATALGQSSRLVAGAVAGDGGVLDLTSLGSGLQLASGRTLGGYGTVLGDVVIAGGAIVAPGGSIGSLTNTGTQTWGGGGRYLFEVTNANGDGSFAGSRWDLLRVSNLAITATSSNTFVIDLKSLTNATDDVAGLLAEGNWDPNTSYQWKFLESTSSTFTDVNFNASWFTVNSQSFLNVTNGSFSVARGGVGGLGGSTTSNELYIVYAAVPEPASLVLAGIGMATAGWIVCRRRRRRT